MFYHALKLNSERFPTTLQNPQQHDPKPKSGFLKLKTATKGPLPKQSEVNLAHAIQANTQRMLESGLYFTEKLKLNGWGSTPVGSSLMEKFLDYLYFPEITHREKNIAHAHEETFEWIFQSSGSSKSEIVDNSFRNWLCEGSGIYWVAGKAGSGKSTLLKSIHYDLRTSKDLERWASGKLLVRASFFFWNSGSEIQMSQEGMMRSLLYQCLRVNGRGSLPSQWDTFILSRNFEKPWT